MTAICAFIAPDGQRAHLWSDGAGIDPEGRIACVTSKFLILEHLPAVIVVRGLASAVQWLTFEVADAFTSFDDLIARFEAWWSASAAAASYPLGTFEIIFGGYSVADGRARLLRLANTDGGANLPANRLVEIPNWIAPWSQDIAEEARNTGFDPSRQRLDDDASMVILRAQRLHGAGMFAGRATVGARGVGAGVIERWADDYIGKLVAHADDRHQLAELNTLAQ